MQDEREYDGAGTGSGAVDHQWEQVHQHTQLHNGGDSLHSDEHPDESVADDGGRGSKKSECPLSESGVTFLADDASWLSVRTTRGSFACSMSLLSRRSMYRCVKQRSLQSSRTDLIWS